LIFNYITRKLRYLYNHRRPPHPDEFKGLAEEKVESLKISDKLKENLDNVKTLLSNSNDIRVHTFRLGGEEGREGALMYFDGMVDNLIVAQAILRPLVENQSEAVRLLKGQELLEALKQEVICVADIKEVFSMAELTSGCLSGDTVLLLDGCEVGLIISSKGWDKRAVTEPQSETVVRGPREGFTENIRTNTVLIRRKIRNGQLRVEQMTVGRKTCTEICIVYLEGVANPKVVERVKGRIKRLDIESVLETGYIEEYIEDAPFSPFSTVGYTEKPDVAAGRVLEGRVAILVDGTPFVLTVPMLFIESFQSAEDYYFRPLYASFIRIVRYIAFFLTIFAPASYIALTSFHQELLPTTLLISVAVAREGTPFPVFLEALIMVFAFEIIREAGVRLPRAVGQTISIVGALIMGEAAVSAGIVGAPVVIVVAVTAVASFIVPNQNDAISMLQILMMIFGATLGFYGIAMGFLGMLIHLATLESFGVPFLDYFARATGMQDSVIRAPLWASLRRPKDIAERDMTRSKFFVPPIRPHVEDEAQDEEE
jgi:spore germination protein KA